MPDSALPQLQGVLASFLSGGLPSFVQMIAQALSAANSSPTGSPANTVGKAIANDTLVSLFGNGAGSILVRLNNAGYLPSAYMVGFQGDLWGTAGGSATAQLAVNFNGADPLDWEVGFVGGAGIGLKAFGGEAQVGIVGSAITNIKSLEQLRGWSATLGAEMNFGTGGAGVAVSNLHPLLCPNITGEQPTVFNVSGSIGPSIPEPVAGGGTIGKSWVASTTPREMLADAKFRFQVLALAWNIYWCDSE